MTFDGTLREELSQSRARLGISALVFLVFAASWATMPELPDNDLVWAASLVGGYFLASIFWRGAIRALGNRWLWRRYLAIPLDLGVISGAMYLSGPLGAAYYPLYFWVVMGNGLRFGQRHLLVGMACGIASYGAVLNFSPYWRAHGEIGIGLLVGMLVLPVFYASVAMRMRSLNARLQRELKRAQMAERAKGEFLANMSHEIRTPLNGVLGIAGLMREADLPPEQRENVELIIRSGRSLLQIVNDVLDFSKVTSGRLVLEEMEFDLERQLRDIEELMGPTARKKDIALGVTYPPDLPRHFHGDPTRVRQVLLNLVGNAIKFTDAGRVDVVVSLPPDAAPGVAIAVSDTGVGIPADRLRAIFEKFEQAESGTARRFGGTGLGLAISREMVQLMGGRIGVRSVVGAGSTFTVVLPLRPAAVEAATAPDEDPRALPLFGLRALVADDNALNRRVTVRQLARLGVTAVAVADGADVLDALDESFDVVLLDVRMPGVGGLETIRRIRGRDDATAGVFAVALTGEADAEDVARSLAAGMDAHLVKPVETEELAAVLAGRFGPGAPTPPAERVGS